MCCLVGDERQTGLIHGEATSRWTETKNALIAKKYGLFVNAMLTASNAVNTKKNDFA